MRSILIHLPFELKNKLEQHPDHHHGNCNEYYCSILKRWTESPEFQLDIANSRIKRLESQIEWLKRQVQQKEGTAEMFKRLWTSATQKPAATPAQDQTLPPNPGEDKTKDAA